MANYLRNINKDLVNMTDTMGDKRNLDAISETMIAVASTYNAHSQLIARYPQKLGNSHHMQKTTSPCRATEGICPYDLIDMSDPTVDCAAHMNSMICPTEHTRWWLSPVT